MNVNPASVIVPERAGPVLAETLKVTVPLPVPVGGDVMVIIEPSLPETL